MHGNQSHFQQKKTFTFLVNKQTPLCHFLYSIFSFPESTDMLFGILRSFWCHGWAFQYNTSKLLWRYRSNAYDSNNTPASGKVLSSNLYDWFQFSVRWTTYQSKHHIDANWTIAPKGVIPTSDFQQSYYGSKNLNLSYPPGIPLKSTRWFWDANHFLGSNYKLIE